MNTSFTPLLKSMFLKIKFVNLITWILLFFTISYSLKAQTVTLRKYLYPTGIGNQNEEIVQIAVDVTSAKTLTQINMQMTGTTSISDVSNIDVYYMGTSYRFNPNTGSIFGSASPSGGTITINGNRSLSMGTHYFYVAYDISNNAVEGNLINAKINSVVISGSTFTPTDVTGSRTILLSQARLARCGDDGSKFYRIPAVATCPDGSLITAYDKRWNNGEDIGVTASNSIDIVSRRSTDGGKTWSAPITIAGNHSTYCYTDPCFIVDYQTGVVFCFMASGTGTANRFSASTPGNPIKIYKIESHDNGLTWINGVDITNSIYGSKCPDATRRGWYAGVVSPGSGIQMANGRLAALLQTRTSSAVTPIHDYLIYSDDHGATWKCSTNSACSSGDGNEAQLVQRADGSILASIRHVTNRYMNVSTDNGISWGTPYAETEITEPGCNGDIARLTTIAGGSDKNRLLQSIPFNATMRTNMSVMLSTDDGNNWPYRKVIYPDMGATTIGSAYSTMCVLPDNTIGLVYELSDTIPYNGAWAWPYEQIHFVRFSLNWLTGGAESLCQPTGFTAPTSNSPQCTNGSITFTQGTCPTGYTCYWQTSATGTSTANSSNTLTITQATPGNYTAYVRGYNGSCWTQALSCVGTFLQAPTNVTATASDNSICTGDAINLFSSASNTETLINPLIEGSFDPGSTFANNGWNEVNGANNKWTCNAYAGANTGMNSAYIGTETSYAGTANASVNHFYRDVVIPSGSTNISLKFYLKMPTIHNGNDFVRVYTTTTAYTPVAGTTPGTGYTQVFSYTTPALANYTLQTVSLPEALAGTTVRIVFTYICNATTPFANPSIDDISLTVNKANYSWSSSPAGFSSSLQNPTGLTPNTNTTYTVTASAANGCSQTASTTVTVSSVTPNFNQLGPYCVGDIAGSLPTTSLNGISGTWTPSTISTVSTGTTTYTFNPNSGQCASSVTMDITVYAAINNPTFSTYGPYCVGDAAGSLPTTSSNGITGTWSPATISTASAGSTNYTFTPSAGQCANPKTITVVVNAKTDPTFSTYGPYCVGDVAGSLPTTSSNGITGTWSPATISTASAGSTNYTFTPTAGQCANPKTITVVTNPIYAFNEYHSICQGSSYTWHGTTYTTAGTYIKPYTSVNGCDSIYTLYLTEVSAYSFVENHSICSGDSYIWQGNVYNSAGTYTAAYTSSTGCDSIYTLNLTINPTYTFNESHSMCNGASYTWHGSTFTTAGTYTAAYTTTNGCDSIYTLNLTVNPLPIVWLGNDTTICDDSYLILDAGNTGATYLWSENSQTGQTITIDSTGHGLGSFDVIVTVNNGCIASDTINITIELCSAINNNDDASLNLYPNPTDGTIYIDYSQKWINAEIELTDVDGKLLSKGFLNDFKGINGSKQFEIGIYPAGVYFMRILTETDLQIIKIIRQ